MVPVSNQEEFQEMSEFQETVDKVNAMTEDEVNAEISEREQRTLEKINASEGEVKETFTHKDDTFTITSHTTREGCWNYSKLTIVRPHYEPIVVPRNYHSMWHTLVTNHPSANEYLLCGHDYQGYDCINLTNWTRHKYVPRETFYGCGFCWDEVEYDPEEVQLIVEGCYWACPYDRVVYDFKKPDELPYPELSRKYIDDDDDDEDDE